MPRGAKARVPPASGGTRLLFLLLLVAGAGVGIGFAVAGALPSKADKLCVKLEQLCGPELDADGCADDLESATDADLAKLDACIMPADSCLETVGCLGGTAVRDLGEGFLRGLMR